MKRNIARAILPLALGTLAFGTFWIAPVAAQTETPSTKAPVPVTSPAGSILLTVFLRHDQSKTLGEINDQLQHNGYFEKFPPPGAEVVSWYVMMGIGQVVTLRVAPDKLREVNVALENTAWGAFRTEFYPTYDYKQLAQEQREVMLGHKP